MRKMDDLTEPANNSIYCKYYLFAKDFVGFFAKSNTF